MLFSFCALHSDIEVTAYTVLLCFVVCSTSLQAGKIGFCELGLESCVSYGIWKPVHLFSLCVFVHICLVYLLVIIRQYPLQS